MALTVEIVAIDDLNTIGIHTDVIDVAIKGDASDVAL